MRDIELKWQKEWRRRRERDGREVGEEKRIAEGKIKEDDDGIERQIVVFIREKVVVGGTD